GRAWDPYPFILLNLMLSMLAAIQAPVIMMSQNRQDTKDRLRGELDYEVNRQAAAEIQGLARKLNLLIDKVGDLDDTVRVRSVGPPLAERIRGATSAPSPSGDGPLDLVSAGAGRLLQAIERPARPRELTREHGEPRCDGEPSRAGQNHHRRAGDQQRESAD